MGLRLNGWRVGHGRLGCRLQTKRTNRCENQGKDEERRAFEEIFHNPPKVAHWTF